MPILRWLARLYRATAWLLLHTAIATTIFLVSAAFGASEDPEQRNGLYVFRVIASFWLFVAVWHFVVRGVLGRPAPAPRKTTPTNAEAARSALGCLAWLAPVAATYLYGGRIADRAWAGIQGDDASHPARQLLARAVAMAERLAAQPDVYVPYIVGAFIALVVVNMLVGMVLARPASTTRSDATPGRAAGVLSRARRRQDVAEANARALQAIRARARTGRPATGGPAPAQVAAGAATAAAVGAAHAGHRAEPRELPAGRPASGMRDDPVLGTLAWSTADAGWWAQRGGDAFPLRIDAPAEGPSARQVELARTVAQRSFEVLLRGSDAARPIAQARGVGLPRFAVSAGVVGADAGSATPVTLHLRCDGPPPSDYAVRSTDGLLTFKAV